VSTSQLESRISNRRGFIGAALGTRIKSTMETVYYNVFDYVMIVKLHTMTILLELQYCDDVYPF
jgi:hypothetical protein